MTESWWFPAFLLILQNYACQHFVVLLDSPDESRALKTASYLPDRCLQLWVNS